MYVRKREIHKSLIAHTLTLVNGARYAATPLGMTCRSVNPVRMHGTGNVEQMKEPYGEGLESHTGSESCGLGRKARYEA